MKDLARPYLDEHLIPKRKASTVTCVRSLLRLHLLPRLGSRKIRAITRDDVARLHRSLAATPAAANQVVNFLSAMMTFAERRELRDQRCESVRLECTKVTLHIARCSDKPS